MESTLKGIMSSRALPCFGLSHLHKHEFRNSFLDSLNLRISEFGKTTGCSKHYLLHCLHFKHERQFLLQNVRIINQNVLSMNIHFFRRRIFLIYNVVLIFYIFFRSVSYLIFAIIFSFYRTMAIFLGVFFFYLLSCAYFCK